MDAHPNFAYSTVASAPSPAASGTTLTVAAGDGALFAQFPFDATVWPINTQPTVSNAEIVRITGRAGDVLTIQRAVEGTSARTIVVGDQIAVVASEKVFTDIEDAIPSIAASNTTYSTGTISITGVGGGVTVSSNTGQRVDISVAAPVAQSVQPETQTFVGAVSASDALYTSGTVRLTGVGGGVTVSSNTGQRVDISVAAPVAQTVQTQNAVDVTLAGNTAGALALISSGTLTLAGGSNITLSQAGNAVTISGATAAGAAFSGGMSTMGNTSGNTGYASQRLNLIGGNNITLSGSTNGGSMSLTISGAAAGGAQTAISGVAASNTTYTSGTVTFTGVGGGITVSSNTGQRIDLSVAAQSVQPETQTFIGGISASNTLYTSGSVRFTGSNAVTVKSGTGQLVVIDVPTQTTQVETQTFVGGIANSQTTYTSGTVSLSELGAITVRSTTGNQFQLSVNAQTTQTQGILSAGVSTGGNTSGNTQVSTGSRLVFVGSNNITLSQGTAAGATTVTISGPSVAGAQTGISGIANSQTTYTSGTVSLSELGAVTIRSTTGNQFQISAPATSSLSATGIVSLSTNGSTISVGAPGYSGGMSTNGNTSGNTGYASQRLNLVGGNNITLSGSTDAGSMSITISAPNLGAGAMSAGASNLGNTAGSTGITGTQLVLVGSDNITLSQSTGANGATLSFIGGGGGGFSGGVSTGGNTLGSTGVTGTQLVFAGVGEITLSQSTNTAGGTISISNAANGTISQWPQPFSTQTVGTGPESFASAATRTTLTVNLFPLAVEQHVSFNRLRIVGSYSVISASTAANWSATFGHSLGIYTHNAGTLSLLSSFSHQDRLSYASTANSTNASMSFQASWGSGTNLSSSVSFSSGNAGVGGPWVSVSGAKVFNLGQGAMSISPGQYFAAYGFTSSSVGTAAAIINGVAHNMNITAAVNPEIGVASGSSTGNWPLIGYVSGTQTNTAIPPSIATADISTATNVAANVRKSVWVQMVSQF